MQLFINNWASRLASPLASASLTMLVPAEDANRLAGLGSGDHYLLTLIAVDATGVEIGHEIVKVTANASGSLTVERAQEGTTAAEWPTSTPVGARLTSGGISAIRDSAEAYRPFAPVVTEAGAARVSAQGDAGSYIRFTSTGAKTYTVQPQASVAWVDDSEIHGRNVGATDLTLVPGSGVTLNAPSGGTLLVPAGGSFTLKRAGTDEWDVIGQTAAAP